MWASTIGKSVHAEEPDQEKATQPHGMIEIPQARSGQARPLPGYRRPGRIAPRRTTRGVVALTLTIGRHRLAGNTEIRNRVRLRASKSVDLRGPPTKAGQRSCASVSLDGALGLAAHRARGSSLQRCKDSPKYARLVSLPPILVQLYSVLGVLPNAGNADAAISSGEAMPCLTNLVATLLASLRPQPVG